MGNPSSKTKVDVDTMSASVVLLETHDWRFEDQNRGKNVPPSSIATIKCPLWDFMVITSPARSASANRCSLGTSSFAMTVPCTPKSIVALT